MRRRRIAQGFWAVLVGLSLATVAPRVHAYEHLRSQVEGHQALWYYWPTRYLDYYVQDTGGSPLNIGPRAGLSSAQIQAAAQGGFDAWQQQTCTDIQFTYRGIVTDRDSNMTAGPNSKNTIIFRYDDWDGTECQEAIACTTVVTRRSAGEILDADIDLNLKEYSFVLEPLDGSPAFDLQSVLTHEIGHMIGFDHPPDHVDAVMYAYASWGESKTRRVLSKDDIDVLCETYPAGGCTRINDHLQEVCPETVLSGGCTSAGTPVEGGRGWLGVLVGLMGLTLFAIVVLRRRK